jgi:DNA-directed RNA polymerase specialized sigma24 family protein
VSGADEREAEFQDFVVARSPGLYRTALLLTASPHAAEDLVQATLVKTYVAWWRVRGATDPVAYAHGILVKTFRSDRRRRSSQELPTDRVLEAGPSRGGPTSAGPSRPTASSSSTPSVGCRTPTGPWWCCATGRT